MQNAGSGRGVASHLCHLLSHLPSIPGGKLGSARCHGMSGHGHLHTGSSLGTDREGSRSLSCTMCSSSQAGPAISSLQGIPRHSRPLRCAQQEEDPWQPLWLPQRCGANEEVLGNAEMQQPVWRWPWKTSTRNLLLFLPSPSPSETFVPDSSQLCRAQSGRMVHRTWVLVWGRWGTPLSPAGSISPLCCSSLGSWGSCVALAQGKEGLANRIRSCGPSQQPQVLASPGAPPCSWPCSVLWQTLQEVLRAVFISHQHLGTVASAPAAAPSEATPSARAGWDCPCCSWPCPGAPRHPVIALKLLGAPGFPQLAAPTILSAWRELSRPSSVPGKARKVQ